MMPNVHDRPGDNERDLAIRVAAGDAAALEQLLISMHPRILAEVDRALPFCLRSLIDATDVLQDVYYDAFYHLPTYEYRGEDSAFMWLRQIARNRIIVLLRRHRAIKRGGQRITLGINAAASGDSVEWALDQMAIYHRTPSSSAIDHEAAAAVEAAVDRLPAAYRDVINLRYFNTLPFRSVAEKLRTTEAAVKMMCGRAIDRLRTELKVEFQQKAL